MAFGDSDLSVFFDVTGVSVVLGGQSTRGNLDEPGVSDLVVGLDVQDDMHTLEIARGSLSPMPDTGDVLVVDGRSFKVRNSRPVDDGAIVRIGMKAVAS